MDDETLASWRKEYTSAGLVEADVAEDPLAQFARWLKQAYEAGIWEPNAMVLSTVGATGAPSSRIVLLKGFSAEGLVFYTNYESRKAADLENDPRCCLLFPWHPLERQVRIEGVARRVDGTTSDRYFRRRPRGAQIGAWASPQSSVVESRESLDEGYDEMAGRWPETESVPRPESWGGYRVSADRVEFWQGRPGRMHDRLRYRRTPDGGWVVERLAP
jgi:pyridoxamine 5'-phosphate oxidase